MYPQDASSTPPPVPEASAPLVISTDRPSFTDSATIVPLWHLQLESGLTYDLRDRNGVRTDAFDLPEVLLRFAVAEPLEIRLNWQGWFWLRNETIDDSERINGSSDLSVGAKLLVATQQGLIPRMALEALTTVGAGTPGISRQKVEPTFKYIWSYDLGSGFSVGGNLNLAFPTTDGHYFAQGQASAILYWSPIDKTTLFAEYYAIFPNTRDSGSAQYLDFGVEYLLDDRVQIDAKVGVGLTRNADNFYVGAGISFLF